MGYPLSRAFRVLQPLIRYSDSVRKGRGCDNRRSIERLYIFFFPDVYLSNVALAHENDGVKSFNFMTQQSRRQHKEMKTRRGCRGGNGDGDDDDGAKKLTKRAIINTKRGLEAVEDRQQCCRSLRSEHNWPTRKHTHPQRKSLGVCAGDP